jgi:hypothetical protein
MSLSDLASVASVINGVAVAISLIFVGFQLLQNTRAVRASSSQALSSNYQQLASSIIEHNDFARIWRVGIADISDLTDDEVVRFVSFLSGVFRFFEAMRLQWLHGQLDAEHWHNIEQQAVDFSVLSGVRSFWTIRRHWHSTEFQTWFESLSRGRAHHALYDRSITAA